MKRIENIEDQMRDIVTYEFDNGQRVRFDARIIAEFGVGEMMRSSGMGHLLPTERLPVMHHGRRVGTMPPDFDPNNIKSRSYFYNARPRDFIREGDTWVAARTLGPRDVEAVAGFLPDVPKEPMTMTDGWKLVPVEPTEEMMLVARNAIYNVWSDQGIRDCYRAMLSAAPPPPAGEEIERLRGALEQILKGSDERGMIVSGDMQEIAERALYGDATLSPPQARKP